MTKRDRLALPLLLAAIGAACLGAWWLVPLLVATSIACTNDGINRRRRATNCRVSQLRRRQLDDLDQISDSPTPPG